jgi:hypothetical protein
MTAHITAVFATAIPAYLASSVTAHTALLPDRALPNVGSRVFCHRISHGPAIGNDADPAFRSTSASAFRHVLPGNSPALQRCPAMRAIRRCSFRHINFLLCCMHAED